MIFHIFPINQARVGIFFPVSSILGTLSIVCRFHSVGVSCVPLTLSVPLSYVFLSHLTLLVPAVPAAVLVPVSRHVYAIPTGFLSRKYLKGKLGMPREVS